jgi:hypothetical protein
MEPTHSQLDEPRCARCGGFATIDLGDRHLCEDCWSCAGSCCPEFGADDLWTGREEADA